LSVEKVTKETVLVAGVFFLLGQKLFSMFNVGWVEENAGISWADLFNSRYSCKQEIKTNILCI